MNGFLNPAQLLAQLALRIPQITPREALQRQAQGAALIDVREDAERAAGLPMGAIGLARGLLASNIGQLIADPEQEILTICAHGQRSLLAADTLQQLGYRHVASVQDGFVRWQAENLPITYGALDADATERYSRHLLLPEVGQSGQIKLAQARIALVGAGGLGSPAALYLAASGVGHLTIIDDDRVERSNLQRQVLHTDQRVGMLKTESAQIALTSLNPHIVIQTHAERLQAHNVENLLAGHDAIIDGADNFPTRYLLNAASLRLKIPLIYGAVHRFTGQLSVFDPRQDDSPCYRCLFPHPPAREEAPNCAEAGVLGVLPGVIGLLQATEAIKLILGQGRTLTGRLLCYDALATSFRELTLPRDPDCPSCATQTVFSGYQDIEHICISPLA